MKQWVEPESISAETWREELEISGEVREMRRELGLERADNLGKGTERVNAVLRLCRGLGTAQSFFKSEDSLVSLALAWMAWALALEADDEDFGQSFEEWLGPPQNMHKLLSKRHCLSCRVNFPSLPSLSVMDAKFPEED